LNLSAADLVVATYRERKLFFSQNLRETIKAIAQTSYGRVLIALLFILTIYLGLGSLQFFYLLFPLTVAFIFLMRRHNRLFNQKSLLERLVELNVSEEAGLKNQNTVFPNGDRFKDPHHAFSYDLDLFGEASLFQYVNRCSSLIGEKALAKSLTKCELNNEQIIDQQEAVSEMKDKLDFRQNMWAQGRLFSENLKDKDSILEWLREKNSIYPSRYFKMFIYFWPIVTICLSAGTLVSSLFTPFALLAIGVQWVLTSLYLKRTTRLQSVMGRKKKELEKFSTLLRLISQEKFESKATVNLGRLSRVASDKLNKLAALTNSLENRMNAIATLFGNSFFLYDLHCIYNLEEWRTRHGHELPHWLDTIAEMDKLCSLGTFYYNNPSYSFPKIEKDKLIFEASDLGHPLLGDGVRVTNPVSLGSPHKALVITGANMAGKSTYLRAIGVNSILAMIGAPVCASHLRCSIFELHTGMRTADSLHENQSYFYAELNRLKKITIALQKGNPVLVLLDEILKGTNSEDKQKGSIALVKQLIKHHCLTIVATHDLALGTLNNEFPESIENYSFESTIAGNQLSFDYTLKPGMAKNANATFLMKQMGIIPEMEE
jgi:fumarate reductase subunit D